MNLDEIRRKYRQILEESQDGSCSSSDDEKVLTLYEQMQSKKKCLLASSSTAFNKENKTTTNNDKQSLALREKLAQAIETIALRDEDIKRLTDGKSNANEQRRLLQRQLQAARRDIAERDTKLVHKEAQIVSLQGKIQDLEKAISEQALSVELTKNQMRYYELEQDKFKKVLEQKDKDIRKIRKGSTKVEFAMRENERLKADVNRLVGLLAQEERFKMLAKYGNGEQFKMSYLGKPQQEMQQWHPRQLIAQTEQFLKSQSIGYGNKQFVAELTKFIRAQCLRSSKQTQDKVNKRHESKVKEVQRRLNHSLNFKQVEIRNRVRHSIGASHSRRMGPFKTKRNTEALLEKSITCNSKITIDKFAHSTHKEVPEDVVDGCDNLMGEFREGLDSLIQQEPVSRKRVMKLCGWLTDSLHQVLRNRRDNLKLSVLEV